MMGIRFISSKDSLYLVYSADDIGPRNHRKSFTFDVSYGLLRIAGLYHVKTKNLVGLDFADLKEPVGDASKMYRIAHIRNHYYEFDSHFLGGEHLPINLWISTAIPISDELFRETGLIEDIRERERMGYDPVVVGGDHPDAMPMALFFSC